MGFLKRSGGILLVLFFLGPLFGWAQEDVIVDEFSFGNVAKQESPEQSSTIAASPHQANQMLFDFRMAQQKYRFYLCILVSIALVVSLIIVLRFITRTSYEAMNIIHISGLIFIVFGTIFIVILADVDAQLTAAMGILGAIAGYLFGTMRRDGASPTLTSAENLSEKK